MYKYLLAISPVLFITPLGCDTAKDNQKEAIEAQREANEKITEVQAEARDKVVNAQAKANEGIAEANADYLKLREDFRHDINKKVVTLNEKIAKAEARLGSETGQARTKLMDGLPAVRSARDAFLKDLDGIKDTTAATWDSAKVSLQKQWDELEKLVDRTID
jgi:F0F1-type ATP synthase membrane subunit b/b'